VKSILQIILALLFVCNSVVFANDFREVFKFSLKKDEQKKILVKYDNKEKIFVFRWTLYVNEGLVILSSYDGCVAQKLLYLNHKNQSFRLQLKSTEVDFYNPPYFLLKFKEFDSKKKQVKFELYLYDDKMQIALKFLKNKQN